MSVGKVFRVFRWLFVTTLLMVLFMISADALSVFYEVKAEKAEIAKLFNLPNYNYVPEIIMRRDKGDLDEALQLAKFVIKNPDLPEQEKAVRLEHEIEAEMNSPSRWINKAMKGFFTGSVDSGQEIAGAIASDMVIYGDIRDLTVQGYRGVTGQEVDTLVASLSGVGLLTEFFDAVDWVPSVFKIFRKAGVLTSRFVDMFVNLVKKSQAANRIDDSLKLVFSQTADLVEKMGMKRSASVFRYVDTADDLAAISKLSIKAPDEAYLLVKWGGDKTFDTLKKMDLTDENLILIRSAAKKGPDGARFLDSFRKGGVHSGWITRIRVITRFAKNIKLGRVQKSLSLIIQALLERFPMFLYVMWTLALATGLFVALRFIHLLKNILGLFRRKIVTEEK